MTNPNETWETNQAAADEYEAAKYGTPVARCPACALCDLWLVVLWSLWSLIPV